MPLCCGDAKCAAFVFSPAAPRAMRACEAGGACCYLKNHRAKPTRSGAPRARSHRRFVLPLIHVLPDSLTYSVLLFLKRQCDRTLGLPGISYGKMAGRGDGAAAGLVPPPLGIRSAVPLGVNPIVTSGKQLLNMIVNLL